MVLRHLRYDITDRRRDGRECGSPGMLGLVRDPIAPELIAPSADVGYPKLVSLDFL